MSQYLGSKATKARQIAKLAFLGLAVLLVAACRPEGSAKAKITIGMTVQDLSNPTWLGYCQAIQKETEAQGGMMEYVGCQNVAEQQVKQIERFVAKGVDVVIVHPAAPAEIEEACRKARLAGVKVISWDDDLANADLRWIIDDYELGRAVGTAAAKFIESQHQGTAEVAILNYPQLPILLARENGIRESLQEFAPGAKIVAEMSAINPKEGILRAQQIFGSHPDVKVFCCIGGGGSVGANEVALAENRVGDDFGIFAVDATKRELEAIKNEEGVRMSVIVTGTAQTVAKRIFELAKKLKNGKDVEERVYRDVIPVTRENVGRFYQQKS